MAEDPPENVLEEVNFSHENASDSSIPEDVRTYDRFSINCMISIDHSSNGNSLELMFIYNH